MKNTRLIVILVCIAAVLGYTLFSTSTVSLTVPEGPLAVIGADVNLDGKPDLVAASQDGRKVSIFLGNGDGSFQEKHEIALRFGITSIAVEDLNADDLPDLALTICANDCQDNGFLAFYGNGKGEFERGFETAVEGVVNNIVIFDLNGDGVNDLAGSDYSPGRLILLLSAPDDSYEIHDFESGSRTISLEKGDIDGDGQLDLITSNQGDGTISVFLNRFQEEGKDLEKHTIPVGELPFTTSVGDFNQDNATDMVVSHSTDPGQLTVFLGDPQGKIEKSQTITFEGRAGYAALGDFNNDSFADLIVGRIREEYALVFLNDGKGVFSENAIHFPTTTPIDTLTTVDLNGDGLLDLVSADFQIGLLGISISRKSLWE